MPVPERPLPAADASLSDRAKKALEQNVLSWEVDNERMQEHAAALLVRLQFAATLPHGRKIVQNNLAAILEIYNARKEALGKSIREKAKETAATVTKLETSRAGLSFGSEALQTIRRIVRLAVKVPEPGKERGSNSYLTVNNEHVACSAQIVADIAELEKLMKAYADGTPQKKYLQQLHEALLKLRQKDSSNASLYSVPTKLSGGEKMLLTVFGGLYAALRFAAAAKQDRLSITGSIIAVLLLYMHSNPGSKIQFLSESTFADLADRYGIKGPDGEALAKALMSGSGQRAIQNFSDRQKALVQGKPKDKRDPKARLLADLRFQKDGGPGRILNGMSIDHIQQLSRMLGAVKTPQERTLVLAFINPGVGLKRPSWDALAHIVTPGPAASAPGAALPPAAPPEAPAEPVLPSDEPAAAPPVRPPDPKTIDPVVEPRSPSDEAIFKFFGDPRIEVKDGIVILPKTGRSPGFKGEMPEGIVEIRGGLQLVNAPIKILPMSLRKIDGTLDFGYVGAIPRISKNLEVTSDLYFDENPIPYSDIWDMLTHGFLKELEENNASVRGKIHLRNVSEKWLEELKKAHPKLKDKLVREEPLEPPKAKTADLFREVDDLRAVDRANSEFTKMPLERQMEIVLNMTSQKEKFSDTSHINLTDIEKIRLGLNEKLSVIKNEVQKMNLTESNSLNNSKNAIEKLVKQIPHMPYIGFPIIELGYNELSDADKLAFCRLKLRDRYIWNFIANIDKRVDELKSKGK